MPRGHLIRRSKIRLVMILLLSFVFTFKDAAFEHVFHPQRKIGKIIQLAVVCIAYTTNSSVALFITVSRIGLFFSFYAYS